MSEIDVIQQTPEPATRQSLLADLRKLGVRSGMTLLVHSSLSSLGWVCGGPQAVVEALRDALGGDGTLVMPTYSTDLSDPRFWCNPPVPTNWWPTVRESMPAFDHAATPTRDMGRIVECFRASPGVRRSDHPQHSFAAIGPNTDTIIDDHQFNFALGEGSPLARIYDLGGHVLLLGVGHNRNTSLHLAEYRMQTRPNKPIENGAPVLRNGKREWVRLQDIELHDGDFIELGRQFAIAKSSSPPIYVEGTIALAKSSLMSQVALVDFATAWMEKTR